LSRFSLTLGVALVSGAIGAGAAVLAVNPSLIPAAKPGQPAPSGKERELGSSRKAPSTNKRRDPMLVAAGDIACDPGAPTFNNGFGTTNSCRQRYTAELLARLHPDAVLVLGDDQYDDARYAKYLRSYDTTWGRFKRISYPTPGDGFSLRGYYRYWGRRARPSGVPWYSFRLGAWHVISLNSNCSLIGGCGSGSPQVEWLRRDLRGHPADCQLAFWHEPRFSSTEPADTVRMKLIWNVLSEFGVELVLSGEAHNYERFGGLDASGHRRPGGVRQFIVGTGGKSLSPFTRRSPGRERGNSGTFGVLKLTLHPQSYAWRFVPVPESSFGDAGAAPCH
jgi:hypothetical protein